MTDDPVAVAVVQTESHLLEGRRRRRRRRRGGGRRGVCDRFMHHPRTAAALRPRSGRRGVRCVRCGRPPECHHDPWPTQREGRHHALGQLSGRLLAAVRTSRSGREEALARTSMRKSEPSGTVKSSSSVSSAPAVSLAVAGTAVALEPRVACDLGLSVDGRHCIAPGPARQKWVASGVRLVGPIFAMARRGTRARAVDLTESRMHKAARPSLWQAGASSACPEGSEDVHRIPPHGGALLCAAVREELAPRAHCTP